MNQTKFYLLSLLLFIYVCTSAQQKEYASDRKLILRDEGLSELSFVDITNPKANWYKSVPPGRDLQLVGNNRVLIGTGSGYEERDISTGNKVFELTSFDGTIAARRLRNGNTLLVGLNWQSKDGIVLLEVTQQGIVKSTIVYPGFTYVRLVRETSQGTFLITANNIVFEGNAKGTIIWQAKIEGPEKTNAWQAVRVANGNTVVSSGYGGNIQIFGTTGSPVTSIAGPEFVHPNFYAGFQILKSGNFVVTNWQGHGPDFGGSGVQLLEYTPAGELVWSWKQDAEKYSSLQGVIVLDGLDTNLLHVENEKGVLDTKRNYLDPNNPILH
jgi:hypothetical protein